MALNETPRPKERSPADLPDAVRSLTMGVMAAMAVATAITHLAQAVGISFRLYAVVTAGTTLVVLAVLARREYPGLVGALRSSASPAAALGLLAALAAIATLFTHRPRVDDFWYIPNVVYFVAHSH